MRQRPGVAMPTATGGDRSRGAMVGGGAPLVATRGVAPWPRGHRCAPPAAGPAGSRRWGADRDDVRGKEEEEGAATATVLCMPATIALPASREGGRKKVSGRTEGMRRSLRNEKLKPSIYLPCWILREAEEG